MSRVNRKTKSGVRNASPAAHQTKQLAKEAALMETLHDAEIRQQQSFIKTRSQQLDKEIKSLRQQLKISEDSVENESLKSSVAAADLKVKGFGLGKVEFDNDKYTQNVTKMNNKVPQSQLDRSRSSIQPKTVKDHLVIFLAKIKLKMEDVNMSSAELRELMLPSDLVVPEEYTISIGELTGVLQTDLLMPVTKGDQMMVLNAYGTSEGEIDVRALLSDAGVWYDGATSRDLVSPERRSSPDAEAAIGTGDLRYPYSPERSPTRLPAYREDRLGKAAPDKTTRVLGESERALDELQALHELILEEKDFDYDMVPETKRRPFTHSHNEDREGDPYAAAQAKTGGLASDTTKDSALEPAHPESPIPSTPIVPPASRAEAEVEDDGDGLSKTALDRMSALQRENERLKQEIAPFDSEFFEQLEDLKFRYSRLQEIVGEDPRDADTFTRTSALPLDRLSWSVRNSMTAMDRAGLTSPLVARPRYSNAYTYSPGGGGSRSTSRDTSPSIAMRTGTGFAAQTWTPGREHIGGRAPGRDASLSSSLGIAQPLYERGAVDDRAPELNEHERDYLDRQRLTARYPGDLQHSRRAGLFDSARIGGQHGIGAGTHSFVPDEVGGSYSNLCERRLAFELSQHPAPEQATRSLIHRVMDAAAKPGSLGFVTVPQLAEVFDSVKLRLSPAEIELLATGFASNAKGGVDATEFCEAVKSLLYNLVGEHAARAAEAQARLNGQGAAEGKDGEERVRELLLEICEGIITHDKRAVIGNSTNLHKTLLRPFVEQDERGSGLLDFRTFHDVLKDIGVLLTHQDVLRVARHYAQPSHEGVRAESAYPTSNLNHLQSFRDAKLKGSLRGVAKTSGVMGDWLASSGIGLSDAADYDDDGSGAIELNIDYNTFVGELAEILIKLLERDGGVVIGNKFPWILKEYEFVDALICQLEEMKPTQRRKVLMSLQYALSAADPKQECDLDGFTVLNALLSSGFRLQRVNRVRLLRAVEELGGKMDYRDLCQVLLNSCADWTADERQVVRKILKSMGVTVIERRNWLAKLRQSLMDASSKVARKSGRWFASESGAEDGPGAVPLGIPPSAFLHCLRDCNVTLTVEEEATLLDCLDTERLAQLEQAETERGPGARGKEAWSIPMIEYDTFLQYCNRHCGSWTDAAPEVDQAVKWAMKSISNPVLAVHEFASLMHAFDESSAGSVSKRAFQISCHRSRLLANLPEDSITSLADILTMEGGGRIDYTAFIVYLRATCSSLSRDTTAPGIIEQLIANGTDNKGTLLPLRNWLIRHTDMESFLLTAKDMNALLREFSVMYRPEDLEELLMDIGKHVDTNSQQRTLRGTMDVELALHSGNPGPVMKRHVVDSRDLMLQILKARPRWSTLHPYLRGRMLSAMQQVGSHQAQATMLQHSDQHASYDTTGAGTAAGRNLSSYGNRRGDQNNMMGGARGIETAVARKVLSRLRAFAGRSAVSLGALDRETRIRDGDSLMVERDIFKHLTGVTGLPLSDEDVLILADATDFLPEASRVRCDVILETLVGGEHTVGSPSQQGWDEDGLLVEKHGGRGTGAAEKPVMTEACLFALDHLRDLLWKHAARLHRSTLEWNADVRTVFKGFDKTKSGFISSEDFAIALDLLNARVAPELLQDIVFVPEGPGLIDYNEILEYVLVPPTKAKPISLGEETGQRTTSAPSASRSGGDTIKIQRKVAQKESPIQLLLHVIRKSLHHFIVSDHSLEQAWVCLLKVFQRFDPQETNQVSPRDFCLAVSVLLDGDDVVLTKSEWAEIIDHFASLGMENAQQKRHQVDFLGGAMVDYMLFCEAVLDPKEIKSKLSDRSASSHASDRRSILERGKQHLSKSTPLQRKNNQTSRADTAATSRSSPGFHGHVVGSSYSSTAALTSNILSKPSASASRTSTRHNPAVTPTAGGTRSRPLSAPRGLHIDQGDDEVLSRFQQQPRRSSLSANSTARHSSGGGALGYNNAGAAASDYDAAFDKFNANNVNISHSSTGAAKSAWNTDDLYRVARTQGQASRASARTNKSATLRSPPKFSGTAGPMESSRSTYASSHANRGSGQSRFNWDA